MLGTLADTPAKFADHDVQSDLDGQHGVTTAIVLLWTASRFGGGTGFPHDMARRLIAGRALSIAQARGLWNTARAEGSPEHETISTASLDDALDAPATPRFAGIASLMTEFAARVSHPKLAVATADGDLCWLSIAGAGARFPGSINVTSSRHYGGDWFGRIVDGDPRDGLPELTAILSALDHIESEPTIEAAVERHGHVTGRCLNCARSLSNPDSVTRGVGPDCAKRLGLGPRPAAVTSAS